MLKAVEREKHVAKCYKDNHPQTEVETGDICDRRTWDKSGQVHIIAAGFSCQPYSGAGLQRGLSDRRAGGICGLLDALESAKAPFALLENVEAFLT